MMPASGSLPAVRSGAAKRARRRHAPALEFTLAPVPPFRLALAAWTIRRRPENHLDRWDGETYRRVLPVDGRPVEVAVRGTGSLAHPRLHIHAAGDGRMAPDARAAITRALERALGLRADLAPFYRLARGNRRLRELAEKYEGMKPPRFPTIFEALVNGIACQQISLTVGIQLLNRLTELAGLRLETDEGLRYGFPQPAALACLQPAQIAALGFSRAKARALVELARKIVSGELVLEGLETDGNEAVLERLLELRGVGPWTAEYTLLRGLGRVDVFPVDDIGARNRLGKWLRLRRPMTADGARRFLEQWRPYAGIVYFMMLLEGLTAAGGPADSLLAGEKLEKIESDV